VKNSSPETSENSWNSEGGSFEAKKDSASLADLIWGIEMLRDFQLMPGLALWSRDVALEHFPDPCPRGRIPHHTPSPNSRSRSCTGYREFPWIRACTRDSRIAQIPGSCIAECEQAAAKGGPHCYVQDQKFHHKPVLMAQKNAQNSEFLNGARIICLEKELKELYQKQSQEIFYSKHTS
jgi:hypothetical protein